MGLFDGAPPDGAGRRRSGADLAPAGGAGGGRGAWRNRSRRWSPGSRLTTRGALAGVILNTRRQPAHAAMLRARAGPVGCRFWVRCPAMPRWRMPSRHLGLVQAGEHRRSGCISGWRAALVGVRIWTSSAESLAGTSKARACIQQTEPRAAIACRARRLRLRLSASAGDWQRRGAIAFFSPLADEPVPEADRIFLPGGYPELHAGTLAANRTFMTACERRTDHRNLW